MAAVQAEVARLEGRVQQLQGQEQGGAGGVDRSGGVRAEVEIGMGAY